MSGDAEVASFFPIAARKQKGAPGLFDAEERKIDSGHVNRIRQFVKQWRDVGWPDVTPVSHALLERLFFCQLEALETLIFIMELAKQSIYGPDKIEKNLCEKGNEAGTELFRVA
jgi:type III restriction enzyme